MKNKSKFTTLTIGIIFTLLAAFSGLAQPNQPAANPKLGVANGSTYSVSDIESINLTNGNLILNIPLAGLPKGRGDVGQSLSLRYNSKLLETTVETIPNIENFMTRQRVLIPNETAGWQFVFPSSYQLHITTRPEAERNICHPNDFYRDAYVWNVEMIMPDGSKVLFRPTGYNDLGTTGGSYSGDKYYNISPNGYVTNSSIANYSGNVAADDLLQHGRQFYEIGD
jgi:hypothetical protein